MKVSRVFVVTGVAALCWSGWATEELPEVVVRVDRAEQEIHRVAGDVTVVQGEDILSAGYTTLVDGLARLGGVHVKSTSGNPTTAEVSLRGFGENSHGRVLVLLDGRRLNRPDLATINWLQIPLSSVDRVEIVRGARSALYGDQAVAGVIKIYTTQGSDETTGFASIEAASYETSVYRAGASGSKSGLGYSVNAERHESGGYRDRSAFLSWGGGAALSHDISSSSSADIDLSWQSVFNELPGGLTKAQMEADPRQSVNPADEASAEYLNASIGVDAALGDGDLSTVVALGRKDMATDMATWSSFNDFELETLAITPSYAWVLERNARRHEIVAGFDGYWDTLALERYDSKTRNARQGEADIRKTSFGGFLRAEGELPGGVLVGLGGRVESVEYDADVFSGGARTVDENDVHKGSAWDVSVVKHFGPKGNVFARYGTVYRYPFVDEQVSYWGFNESILETLDPEKGWNAEAGARLFRVEGFSGGLTVFHAELEDEIAYNSATLQNENMDETLRQGIEADVSWVGQMFSARCSYTYTEAEFASGPNDGKSVPLVPQDRVGVSLRTRLPAGFRVDATGTYAGDCYLGGDNANTGDELSDYIVVDLFLRFVCSKISGLEVYAGAENIFDEEYATTGFQGWTADAYYPASGTTWRGGLSHRF